MKVLYQLFKRIKVQVFSVYGLGSEVGHWKEREEMKDLTNQDVFDGGGGGERSK